MTGPMPSHGRKLGGSKGRAGRLAQAPVTVPPSTMEVHQLLHSFSFKVTEPRTRSLDALPHRHSFLMSTLMSPSSPFLLCMLLLDIVALSHSVLEEESLHGTTLRHCFYLTPAFAVMRNFCLHIQLQLSDSHLLECNFITSLGHCDDLMAVVARSIGIGAVDVSRRFLGFEIILF